MKKYLISFLLALVFLSSSTLSFAQQEEKKVHDTTELAKQLVEQLAKEDFSNSTLTFDETMKKGLPASKIEEVWKSLIGQFGPFKRQLGVRHEKFGKFDIVFVTCEFE